MHINGKHTPQQLKIHNASLEYVHKFKYLGSIKDKDGSCSKDIRPRIGMAK